MEGVNNQGSFGDKLKLLSRKLVYSLVGIIVSISAFIRHVYDNSNEAKAIAMGVRDDQRTMESRVTSQVISQMVIINNQNQEFMRAEFGKMNTKLNRIEFRQKADN